MELVVSKNYPLIKTILTEPTLWELEYGQGHDKENFRVDASYTYLLVKKDGIIVGVFQVREMTKVLLEFHSFLLPQYWGTGLSEQIPAALAAWAAANTSAHNIITMVPQAAKHVLDYLERIGAQFSGLIPNGIVYNGAFSALYLYTYPIRREE